MSTNRGPGPSNGTGGWDALVKSTFEGPPALWTPLSVACAPGAHSPPFPRASQQDAPAQPQLRSSLVIPLPGPLHLSPGVPDADQLLQASSAFHL